MPERVHESRVWIPAAVVGGFAFLLGLTWILSDLEFQFERLVGAESLFYLSWAATDIAATLLAGAVVVFAILRKYLALVVTSAAFFVVALIWRLVQLAEWGPSTFLIPLAPIGNISYLEFPDEIGFVALSLFVGLDIPIAIALIALSLFGLRGHASLRPAGHPADSTVQCTNCGSAGMPGMFCAGCGQALPMR